MSSGAICIEEDSSSEDEEQESGADQEPTDEKRQQAGESSGPAGNPQGSKTYAGKAPTSEETQRITKLEKELEDARKAQRALAAKLINAGNKDGAQIETSAEKVAGGTVGGTIAGLEAELEGARLDLDRKNRMLTDVTWEMKRMKESVEEAKLRVHEASTKSSAEQQEAEEELEKLQQQLAAEQLRNNAIIRKQQQELEDLRRQEQAAREREQMTVAEAKEAAAAEWRQKMENIESSWRGKFNDKEAESRRLSESLKAAEEQASGLAHGLQAKMANANMESSQIKAEFDSFKQMTRRMMSDKEEELNRLRLLEQGLSTKPQVNEANREAAMLQAVAESLRNPDVNAKLRGRIISFVILLLGVVVLINLFRTIYEHSVSILCILHYLGITIGVDPCGEATPPPPSLS